eukprot:493603_1
MATIEEAEYKIYSRPSHDIEDDDNVKITEDNKDKQMIDEALKRIRKRNITNTKDYTWELMHKEYKYHQKQNGNKKKNEIIKQKLSQLIEEKQNEMCPLGHCYWESGNKCIKGNPCVMCGTMKRTKGCNGCYYYTKQTLGQNDWR